MNSEPEMIHVEDRQLLLLKEVALRLRCSVKTVRRLITDGKLRSAKPRGLRLVDSADINSLLQSTTR